AGTAERAGSAGGAWLVVACEARRRPKPPRRAAFAALLAAEAGVRAAHPWPRVRAWPRGSHPRRRRVPPRPGAAGARGAVERRVGSVQRTVSGDRGPVVLVGDAVVGPDVLAAVAAQPQDAGALAAVLTVPAPAAGPVGAVVVGPFRQVVDAGRE